MEQTTGLQTNSQLTVNTDTSKIFIGENRYEDNHYINNSGYTTKDLVAGTVMGRVGATGILVPWHSNASDGSQKVVGILAGDVSVAAGENVRATICVKGDVAKNKLVFDLPGDALETTVSNVRVEDKIKAETVGINLVASTEMTDYDNQ